MAYINGYVYLGYQGGDYVYLGHVHNTSITFSARPDQRRRLRGLPYMEFREQRFNIKAIT